MLTHDHKREFFLIYAIKWIRITQRIKFLLPTTISQIIMAIQQIKMSQ